MNKLGSTGFRLTRDNREKGLGRTILQHNSNAWLNLFIEWTPGSLNRDTILAHYIFIQEGIRDTVPLKIYLSGPKAVISGEDIAMGLVATL